MSFAGCGCGMTGLAAACTPRPHVDKAAVRGNRASKLPGVSALCHPAGMTPCNVQKCPNAANEAVEPLLIVGPLCDEHRARVLAGEDLEVQGSDESVTGTSQPTVLMGDSLLALNQYALLEPPTKIISGSSQHGHLVPLRVQRRGAASDTELTLLVRTDQLRAVAAFFSHVAERFGTDK